MTNESSNAEHSLPPEQAAAKAAILAECDRLTQAGITFVALHFDGSGDEGVNADIKCYATEDYAYEESEAQETNLPQIFDPLGEAPSSEGKRARSSPSEFPNGVAHTARLVPAFTDPPTRTFT
jgi:hypothetical protein